MSESMDVRFEKLLAGLPAETAELARSLRDEVFQCLPDCKERYHGGTRAGLATYSAGVNGPVCCNLQARGQQVRLFIPAGASPAGLGTAMPSLCFRVGEVPDWEGLRGLLEESARQVLAQRKMALSA